MERTCRTCGYQQKQLCNQGMSDVACSAYQPQEPSPKSEDVQHTEYVAYVEGYDRCNACGVYFRPNTRHKCSHTVRPKSERTEGESVRDMLKALCFLDEDTRGTDEEVELAIDEAESRIRAIIESEKTPTASQIAIVERSQQYRDSLMAEFRGQIEKEVRERVVEELNQKAHNINTNGIVRAGLFMDEIDKIMEGK